MINGNLKWDTSQPLHQKQTTQLTYNYCISLQTTGDESIILNYLLPASETCSWPPVALCGPIFPKLILFY